jgi:c(7)-type cytochrome triheme protein
MARIGRVVLTRLATVLVTGLLVSAGFASFFDLPELVPPDQYGTVAIDRLSAGNHMKAVVFSHWTHRARYSCRVCHYELGFEFKTNATEITEEDNLNGLFCGACHNGTDAFGHQESTCELCHIGSVRSQKKSFREFRKALPEAPYGNGIDWVAAHSILEPRYALSENEKPLEFDKELHLAADWTMIPPVVFPHEAHVRILDCANCHPDIFNIKKKTTEHFDMVYILEGKFCGVCHLSVAFPLDDCVRCHPSMYSNH